MIKDKFVKVKVSPSNISHLRGLGYDVEFVHPRWGGTCQTINMSIEHLSPNSNIRVNCVCDECGKDFTRKFSGNKSLCNRCTQSKNMKGNSYGTANKGKILPHMQGENHPRWNPDKNDFATYRAEVYRFTRLNKHVYSQWENFDKIGRCGEDGAYQLDHKVSIKYGFYHKISPELIGSVKNLQIIPWKHNRDKWHENDIDLWDLLY